MGLLNTDPAVRLNATFSPVYPPAGPRRHVDPERRAGSGHPRLRQRLNIGISSFVSVGNKADVSGNDLIQYLGRGPAHVASSSSISRASATRRSSARSPGASARTKPIVAVKAGRSAAGARAARSRTPARSPRATPSSMRCSARPASSGPSDSKSCSTWRRCSPTSPCRAAAGWRFSPTPAAPASWRPTPARPTGSQLPAARRRHARRASIVPSGRRQCRQSRRHAGVGAGRSLPARTGRASCAMTTSTA